MSDEDEPGYVVASITGGTLREHSDPERRAHTRSFYVNLRTNDARPTAYAAIHLTDDQRKQWLSVLLGRTD